MTDRNELLEAALDSLPEGIGLAGVEGKLAFWNRAAEEITGHASAGLMGLQVRDALDKLIVGGASHWINQTDAESKPGHGSLIHVRHRMGHELPAMARVLVLRDGLGHRIGTGVAFHPTETLDALPHGQTGGDMGVEESQLEVEDRLATEFEDFKQGGAPFGVLWITVDQSHDLRKSHGARACEAMLEIVERTLLNGLRPTEKIRRWGDDEFLVLSHERTPDLLTAHGQILAGLARTADFRWWGDRVSLTVSIGAVQAETSETLAKLLDCAQSAMIASIRAGGNHITSASTSAIGGDKCLPS